MDERRLVHSGHPSSETTDHEEDSRASFFGLEGWVFLGSIGHDGEEIAEAIRCKRCGGTGHIDR